MDNFDATSFGSPDEKLDLTLGDFIKQQPIDEKLVFQLSATTNPDLEISLTDRSQETLSEIVSEEGQQGLDGRRDPLDPCGDLGWGNIIIGPQLSSSKDQTNMF